MGEFKTCRSIKNYFHSFESFAANPPALKGNSVMVQELTAGIPYTVDTGEKLVNETFGPNNIRRRKSGSHELVPMAVRNGRLLTGEFSLEQNGFELVEHKTAVANFFDIEQLESVY